MESDINNKSKIDRVFSLERRPHACNDEIIASLRGTDLASRFYARVSAVGIVHMRNIDEGSADSGSLSRLLGHKYHIIISAGCSILWQDDDRARNSEWLARRAWWSNHTGGPTKCHLNIHEAERWGPFDGEIRVPGIRCADYKFANFPRANLSSRHKVAISQFKQESFAVTVGPPRIIQEQVFKYSHAFGGNKIYPEL